jgi:hypothetical protein
MTIAPSANCQLPTANCQLSSPRARFTLDRTDNRTPTTDNLSLPLFHTVPPQGRYRSKILMPEGGHKIGTLIVDDLAYERILANFATAAAAPDFAGLLVDREHLSEQPDGDSTAAAWAKTIARREDGLWTGWELTALGETLIPTKNFKFRSPVFDLERVAGHDDQWRPVRLVSIALTNVPHFKQLAPNSLNREDGAATSTPEGGSMSLFDKLRARFQKPDATEDDLTALVESALTAGDTAKAECSALTQKVKDFETAKLEAAADAFVKDHGAKVSDTAKLRARYMADPAGTLETVSLLKVVETPACAGTHADRPAAPRALGRDQTEQTPAPNAKLKARAEAIDAAAAKHRCTRARAWELVQQSNPELFND